MMKRKILLIAHHFPPYGGPRSRRWVRFLRHTAPYLDFDVLTGRHAKAVGAYEDLMDSSIPGNAKVTRAYPGPLYGFSYRSLPPARAGTGSGSGPAALRSALKKVFRAAIEVFLVPDKTVEWIPWGYAAAARLARSGDYDAIISSAFPFSDHVLACLIKKRTGLPWIADFGDPWAFNDGLPFRARRRILDRRLEAALLKRTDAVVLTTRETEASYRFHYPFLEPERTLALPNGYDEGEFAALVPERGSRFRLVYTGIFYEDRNPEALFEALSGLDIDFELVIAGDVASKWVDAAHRMGLSGRVTFMGHCPHGRALSLQKGADVLVLLGWARGNQVPAKIFEYFGARRPILAIRRDAEDIGAKLVEAHNRGLVAGDRPEEIAAAIRELYGHWQREAPESRFDLGELREYSVAPQADRLRDLIERVVNGGRPR